MENFKGKSFLNNFGLITACLDSLRNEEAIQRIDECLRDNLKEVDRNPEALINYFFFKSLKDRVAGDTKTEEHIYLKKFEIPQIVLFDLLINKFPLVKMAHEIVNQTIVSSLKDTQTLVLIDVGIGRGIQVANLLNLMKSTNTAVKEVVIIGIDVSEELNYSKQRITEAAEGAKFTIEFSMISEKAESLSIQQIKNFIPQKLSTVIVNASLCLHHIQCDKDRIEFFSKIRALRPDYLFLIEPNSDHYTSAVNDRIRNAYTHYSNVFTIIDELDIPPQEKKGLKMFFEREIEDIVALPDSSRFERHQPSFKWLEYIEGSDLTIKRHFALPDVERGCLDVRIDKNGFASLVYKEVDMLSVFMAN